MNRRDLLEIGVTACTTLAISLSRRRAGSHRPDT